MIKPVLEPQKPHTRTVLTVSQLNRQAKGLLEDLGGVWLTGEISNLTRAASGHWYFSLKDDAAQISCAMFRFKTQNLRFNPNEGDKVVVKGKVSLYEARGNYQLVADYMEPAGLGNLQQKLNELTQKLQAEGLFKEEGKRPIPTMPAKIGVITSPSGAAIHDVLTVLERRCPMIPVIIYPTQVQGTAATSNIIEAINIAQQRNEVDVLLVTRGGGSLEDLWCFNEEKLARCIFECQLPIVAAIGHEVDTTIAERVADLRAPTPSAAAELMVPDQTALQQGLDILSISLSEALQSQVERYQVRLNMARLKLADPENTILTSRFKLEKLLQRQTEAVREILVSKEKSTEILSRRLQAANPAAQLKDKQQKLMELELRLKSAWQTRYRKLEHQLKVAVGSLNTLSPLSTLSRGYSIVRDPSTGEVLNKAEQLNVGRAFSLLLSDGEVDCRVEKGVLPTK